MRLEELGEPAARGADRALPRRLHAAAAARDRGAARRGRAARGRRDRRARARASTSASSTRRSASPSRARSPACGRCGGGRGAGARGSRSTSPAQDALDQFFCRHPDEFLDRPVEAAILDHAQRADPDSRTCSPPPTRRRSAARRPARRRRRRDPRRALARARRRPGRRRASCAAAATAATCRAARASRPARSRCARPRSTRSPSSSARSGELLGQVEAERAFSTVHPGAIYLHLGRSYEVARARRRRAPGDRRRLRRRLVHAAEEGDRGLHRGDRPRAAIGPPAPGRRAHFGEVSVTEQVIAYQRKSLTDHEVIDLVAARPARAELPDPGALVRRSPTSSPGPRRCRPRSCSAPCTRPSTPRSRSCRCSRCATAGTSAASRPTSTSRPACRRSSSTTATRAGSGSRAAATSEFERLVADAARLVGECPCADGLPLLRAEPEVRQPQRAAAQGGRARADGGDASTASRPSAARRARWTRRRQIAVIGAGAQDERARPRSPRRSAGGSPRPARWSSAAGSVG